MFDERPRQRFDHRGNLHGGETNMSMQHYQMCETLEEKEHKRWLAHREATLHATFPAVLVLNHIEIPIAKLQELETLGARRLKLRALNLRDLLESTRSNFFGHHKHLSLNANLPQDQLAKWIIDVQVTVAQAVGYEDLDHAAFGASHFAALSARQPAPQQPVVPRQEPCWSQQSINNPSHPKVFQDVFGNVARQKPHTPQQLVGGKAAFPWSQHGIAGVEQAPTPGEWRSQPPTHDGFSLVPPPFEQASRDHDRNEIAWRGHSSAVIFG